MSEIIPEDWKTEHLFVLVGGNPLPNYVAGKTLLKQGGTLHLVHSTGTKGIAAKIAEFFDNSAFHEIHNSSNATEIEDVMKKALSAIDRTESIGLHYTGGTKAMAVHSHRAFRVTSAKQKRTGVLSYLDAATFTMRRDGVSSGISIQFQVQPTIEKLLQLHGIELQKSPIPDVVFSELNHALARAHQSNGGRSAYSRWCDQYLRRPGKRATNDCKTRIKRIVKLSKQAYETGADISYEEIQELLRSSGCCKKGDLARKRADLPHVPIPFPSDDALVEVTELMRKEFGVEGDSFDPEEVIAHADEAVQSVKALVAYLDGKWVEHLVLGALLDNKADCLLQDCCMSLDTEKAPYNFEFDVAAMQGYQLFAISCTRSDERGLNKSKLFEAYVRAAQLGGDEARVGLVCCDSSPEVLENQVTRLWGATEGRIKVFGPQDLAHLSERFKTWLAC
ncbi:MAG: hypothetical protein GXP38_05070 [Chloroflexi bacterium]|nr:hypothetical protein [Chloroflexota bacterium]